MSQWQHGVLFFAISLRNCP